MLGLIYVSTPTQHFTKTDVAQLLSDARENNLRHDITGYLHFDGDQFLQYVEGQNEHVEALFDRICADDRHEIIFYLKDPLTRRRFSGWRMRSMQGCREIVMEHVLAQKLMLVRHSKIQSEKHRADIWRTVDRLVELRPEM